MIIFYRYLEPVFRKWFRYLGAWNCIAYQCKSSLVAVKMAMRHS